VTNPARLAPIYFAMLLVPLFWGGAFGVTKHVVSELPPLTTAALRFFAAGVLLAIGAAALGGWNWAAVRRHWVGLGLLAVTGIFGYNYFFTVGIQYTSAINAVLVVVINPVTTALVAVTLLGEPCSWRLIAGVGLSFFGVLVTITKGSLAALANLSFSLGDLYMLGAVATWTAYTSIAKLVMKNVPPLTATSAPTLIGSLMLVAASFTEDGWSRLPALSAQTTAEMIYLIIFPTVVAYFLFNKGIQRIGASRASAYINLTPVNAIWIAALFYGEAVTVPQLIGAALIICGLLLVTVFDVRQAAPPAREASGPPAPK
jgi:drug/metabolite transporter (DMT)-like permease